MSSAGVVVVGSGFGGGVAALRLSEKGYRVTVVEAGRRFADTDFARSPWQLHRLVWAPRLRMSGIVEVRARRRLLTLTGVGVGGGSLAYAGAHHRPEPEIFRAPGWDPSVDWPAELAPCYDLAERMLGSTTVPRPDCDAGGDGALRQVAGDLRATTTFHPTRVGVYFGPPGVPADDPYFDGRGPGRTGCTGCGCCATGCRVGAKNTLVKNYLHLAEQLGARIRPLTTVTSLHPQPGGGWRLRTVRSGALVRGRVETLDADQVVLAAGAWGTVELLHRCRAAGTLPALSPALGTGTRTNREVLLAISDPGAGVGPGVAISSALRPDDRTLVQLCRLGPGFHPLGAAFVPPVRRFGPHTALLFAMERANSTLTSRYRCGRMTFAPGEGPAEPVSLAAARAVAGRYAERVGGRTHTLWWGPLLRLPFTAHLLGGCPLGGDSRTSVMDVHHRVHGYPGLHIADASAVPTNLGCNPALTITAMAERAFAQWPTA
ncbi:cholesterol oxidase [Streptomyces albospinus]|uniref:Cholesterol oxidase n=1 Tax=Streptomyces albospinus TaxID=285515 RepID=A0ABQ2VLE8_9ACTN|nr:FAD-dependent oxidoreductase [Streptomyces albospinus]GGU96181.1 cholesterol oxidase [Streptomyces albospinus]